MKVKGVSPAEARRGRRVFGFQVFRFQQARSRAGQGRCWLLVENDGLRLDGLRFTQSGDGFGFRGCRVLGFVGASLAREVLTGVVNSLHGRLLRGGVFFPRAPCLASRDIVLSDVRLNVPRWFSCQEFE